MYWAEDHLDLSCCNLVSYKKKHTSRCQVRLLLDTSPSSANKMVLLLSWYLIVASGMTSPCVVRDPSITPWPIASSIATNSVSVELFVFGFCLHEVEFVAPFLSDMKMPLWLCMSGCTAYELSTHQFGWPFSSNVYVRSVMPHRYCITLVSIL